MFQLFPTALADPWTYTPPLGLSQPVFTGIVIMFSVILVMLVSGLFWAGFIAKRKSLDAANALYTWLLFYREHWGREWGWNDLWEPRKPYFWKVRPLPGRNISKGSKVVLGIGCQASCVDDPVEARAIWYVAPRSGAVMCPAYVARC
jgi:hypothetical protein